MQMLSKILPIFQGEGLVALSIFSTKNRSLCATISRRNKFCE